MSVSNLIWNRYVRVLLVQSCPRIRQLLRCYYVYHFGTDKSLVLVLHNILYQLSVLNFDALNSWLTALRNNFEIFNLVLNILIAYHVCWKIETLLLLRILNYLNRCIRQDLNVISVSFAFLVSHLFSDFLRTIFPALLHFLIH